MSKQDWKNKVPEEGVDCKGIFYKRIELGRAKDITGQNFNRLTALFRVETEKTQQRAWWLFHCECGNIVAVIQAYVKNGNTKSCGCARKGCQIVDIIGQRFGKLVVIEYSNSDSGRALWKCLCDCGNEKIARGKELRQGKIKSCGCSRKGKLIKDLLGETFGFLKVVDFAYTKDNNAYWKCVCKCGKEKVAKGTELIQGHIISCGCSYGRIRDIQGKAYGILTVVSFSHINERGGSMWNCLCECGNKIIASADSLNKGDRVSCGCLSSSSGEIKIELLLKNEKILYKKEHRISDCRDKYPLPFDFAVFDENKSLIRLIEYDGKQHFKTVPHWGGEEEFITRQYHDLIKNNYCKEHNIPLVRIPYTEKQITLDMLLGDKFLVS